MAIKEDVAIRLERHMVRIPYDGCWIWTGCIDHSGYGEMSVDGKKQRTHRLSYELHNDKIPDGMFVCHTCDEPSCMNPDHLFLGTQKDNIRDCISKGRIARGRSHGLSKLTESEVFEIRAMVKNGAKDKEIATKYGVSRTNVISIRTGNTWGWLR